MGQRLTTIHQAVILAGGKGTRLRPLTETKPKPMVQVAGKPFIEHLIELLKENGIKRVLFLLGYLPNVVVDYFGDGSKFGIEIEYSIGKIEEGTGTRIKNAEKMIDEHFLLLYSDNYWPMQLDRLLASFNTHPSLMMVTVYNNRDNCGEYGSDNTMLVDKDGFVRKYDYSRSEPDLNALDIGFFIAKKETVMAMPEGEFSLQEDFFLKLIEQEQLIAHKIDHPYYPITNEEWLAKAERFFNALPPAFIDRDGVINKKAPEDDYIKNWEEFEFLPGAIEGLKYLQDKGFQLFIVTNQRGVARGMMDDSDVDNIHSNMKKELARSGVHIKDVYYCPHEKNICWCRKPSAGMLYQAARKHYLDLTNAILVGDSESDIKAGERAGCKTVKMKTNGNLYESIKSLV